MAPWFWASRPWQPELREDAQGHPTGRSRARTRAQGCGRLVRGHRQLHPVGRDPRHVQGGRQGGYFDVISVHPFRTSRLRVRHGQPHARDRRAGAHGDEEASRRRQGRIILTELTWPAARGKVPKNRLLGLETTTAGQRSAWSPRTSGWRRCGGKMHITHAVLVRVGHPLRQQDPAVRRLLPVHRAQQGDGQRCFRAHADSEYLHEPGREVPGLSQVLRRSSLPGYDPRRIRRAPARRRRHARSQSPRTH